MEEQPLKILRTLQNTEINLDIILVQEKVTIEALMSISPGSILAFEQSSDAPALLSVNKHPFAHGTVVQSGENYGLRIDTILG